MAKRKLTRKELLKEPDEFITLTGRIISWSKANTKPLTYGGCAILVLILLIIGYGYYQDNRSRVSSELLGDSLLRYQELAGSGDLAQALSEVGPEFDRLVDKFSGQPAGRLAILFYAHYSLIGKEPKKSAGLYQLALKRFNDDPSLTPVILNGLASSYEATGDIDKAIQTYEQLVSLDSSVYTDSALFHLGCLQADEGKDEKSMKFFQRLTTDYPDSSYSRLARERILG